MIEKSPPVDVEVLNPIFITNYELVITNYDEPLEPENKGERHERHNSRW